MKDIRSDLDLSGSSPDPEKSPVPDAISSPLNDTEKNIPAPEENAGTKAVSDYGLSENTPDEPVISEEELEDRILGELFHENSPAPDEIALVPEEDATDNDLSESGNTPKSFSEADSLAEADENTEDGLSFEEKDILSDGLLEEETEKVSFLRKHRAALIIAAAVLVVLIGGYLALCAVVKNTDTILNNISVEGVDVSGLTTEEAALLLESELSANVTDSFIEIEALDETYEVSLGSVLEIDWSEAAAKCYDRGHSSYITAGAYWIFSFFGSATVDADPYAAYSDQLYAALDEAGLTILTSVVETVWEMTDDSLVITLGITGQKPDTDALSELILAAIENGDYDSIIECPMTDDAPAETDLEAIYDEIYIEPTNATLDPDDDYSIVESITGVDFDIDSAKELLEAAKEGEEVIIELVYTEPDIDTETLKENLFSDTLGTYTTSVSGTSARRSNVKLAATSCQVILLPGETFSYNDTVGERTTARGYQAAPAYSNGETVQEVGGGICQVSSTLYVACLYANLEIVERHAHSYASSYVPLGWDATVAWGGADFKFTNNTNYPIKITATYSSDNKLTMSIIGTDETGYTVKIVSQTYSTIAYETETIEDDTLAAGTTVVEQTPYTGYKVQTWRYVYDADGNLISDDEEAYSSYKKRNRIIRVGTKEEETTTTETTAAASDT